MYKILFLFYGSMSVVEDLEGSIKLESFLKPETSEEDAVKAAKEIAEKMFNVDWDYNLDCVKITFRPGAADHKEVENLIDEYKEIENLIDEFVEDHHIEDYDGSGNAQSWCTFIIE